MAIQLKTIDCRDDQLRDVQTNVSNAVAELDAKGIPPLGVLAVEAGRALVGNEDIVLVDASGATSELFFVLPSPRALKRALQVWVTRAGPFAVTVKAVDIPSFSTPRINGSNTISIPAGSETSLTVVSDTRNFWAR